SGAQSEAASRNKEGGTRPPRKRSRVGFSTTPRRAAARVALQTRAVAHQGKVPALAARFALVALGARFGAFLRRGRLGVRARVGPSELLERLRRREPRLGFRLERGRCAGDFGARRGAAERRDVGRPTPAGAIRIGRSRGGWGGSVGGALRAPLHHHKLVGARARQTLRHV